jgi:hypothetical protein
MNHQVLRVKSINIYQHNLIYIFIRCLFPSFRIILGKITAVPSDLWLDRNLPVKPGAVQGRASFGDRSSKRILKRLVNGDILEKLMVGATKVRLS